MKGALVIDTQENFEENLTKRSTLCTDDLVVNTTISVSMSVCVLS